MDNYSKAYAEILEILNYLPKEEYYKIPNEKINYYIENKDNDHKFVFEITKPIEDQNILPETNALIVGLFREYFASDDQKEKINKILEHNEKVYQDELRKKYNPDNLFDKNEKLLNTNVTKQIDIVEYKNEEWYKKLFSMISQWFKKLLNK